MRAKVVAIEADDWRSYPYFLRVEDGIWLPEDQDFMAGRGVNWGELVETLKSNGWSEDRIADTLDKLFNGETVAVNDVYIDVPEAEPYNVFTAEMERFLRYGYVLDENGNPTEIDAENSPLQQAGLI